MAENTSGLKAIFSLSEIYSLFQDALGARTARRRFVEQYVRPFKGMRVLDIGCGPGEMIETFSGVHYTGVDHSQRYIDKAKEKYDKQGEFICAEITQYKPESLFDCAIAFGVFHHLDDAQANSLLALVKTWVKPGGRLVTYDPVFAKDMSFIARQLVSRDRGLNVRTEESQVSLFKSHFSKLSSSVHHDFLRIPYSNIVLVSEV